MYIYSLFGYILRSKLLRFGIFYILTSCRLRMKKTKRNNKYNNIIFIFFFVSTYLSYNNL